MPNPAAFCYRPSKNAASSASIGIALSASISVTDIVPRRSAAVTHCFLQLSH